MFKTETHLHVSEVSRCGKLTAEEMVKSYYEAGFKTLFISDHLSNTTFSHMSDATWREKMDFFVTGYEKAKKVGEKYGMNIILSAEISHDKSGNHYLVYGIDMEYLYGLEDAFEGDVEDVYEYTKNSGAFFVQAHPLRDGKCTPTPMSVDAFELHNSNPRHQNFDEDLLEIVKKYDLPVTAGSDAHRPEDVAMTGVETENEIKTAADYIAAVKEGNLKIIYR